MGSTTFLSALGGLRAWLASVGSSAEPAVEGRLSPIKGAHWFAEYDPLSFWGCFDEPDVAGQLRQLRDDGFNTVFLLIPWHAFFPGNDQRLSPWMLARLMTVLDAARASGLAVIGRLFYPHSHLRSDAERLHSRQYGLLRDPGAPAQLAQQAQALADAVRDSPAWVGEFVSWEDFFAIFDGPPCWSEGERREVARQSGYADWVAQRRRSEEREQAAAHAEHGRAEAEMVPQHGSLAMHDWIGFFDHVLSERILRPIEAAFPNVGLEVRSDCYPLPRGDGTFTWQPFDLHPRLGTRRYAYWGAYFGQRNEGETLSASQAISGLRATLDLFPRELPLVLDQLNFRDSTLHFAAHHARIDEREIPVFLASVRQMLAERKWGYAIWAWRDYRENWLSNPAFRMGMDHWAGNATAPSDGDARGPALQPGQFLSQRVIPGARTAAPAAAHGGFHCELHLHHDVDDASAIALTIDGQSLPPEPRRADDGRRVVRWRLPSDLIGSPGAWKSGFVLRFENLSVRSGVFPKFACVWGFTQTLGVRGVDGSPGPYWQAIKTLNADLGRY